MKRESTYLYKATYSNPNDSVVLIELIEAKNEFEATEKARDRKGLAWRFRGIELLV